MLNYVRLRRFRSCEDITLDELSKVTALIGRNAAGKSNVLHGIASLARAATFTVGSSVDRSPFQEMAGIIGSEGGEANAEVILNDGKYRYTATSRWNNSGTETTPTFVPVISESLTFEKGGSGITPVFTRKRESVYLNAIRNSVNIGMTVSTMPALASLLPTEDPTLAITEPLRWFFAQTKYFPLDEPAQAAISPLISEDEYRQWKADYTVNGQLGENVPMQLLHLAITDRQAFDALARRLGPMGLKVVESVHKNDFFLKSNEAPGRGLYIVSFPTGPGSVMAPEGRMLSFGQLSQGTRRIIRLLTAMAYSDCRVMLIEHPEDGIHKGLVRKVAGQFMAGGSDAQVILTTHSDTLMNELDANDIRFVSMEDGKTQVRKLSAEEVAAASKYVNSDVDGTLAEFLHSVED